MRLIDADTLNFTCTADEDYKCQKIVDCNCCPFHTITSFEIENEPTVQAVPIEVLQEIRQEINKAIDCIPITFSRNNADDCLKRDIKDIFDKHIKEIEDIGDYPNEIPNQFDNLTGSMNI